MRRRVRVRWTRGAGAAEATTAVLAGIAAGVAGGVAAAVTGVVLGVLVATVPDPLAGAEASIGAVS